MAKTATLSVRIDPETKQQAEKLFAQLGISMTSAINMFCRQAITERALPFQPHIKEIPNAETIAAMEEGDQMLEEIKAGKRQPQFKTAEEYFKYMGI